jgi:GalNAc-alpha-(1->4)-GalNAc-alpha-(1->3)-diNAcBac-PP-undecaprenol alpha-1,4-N-acetyl-D-galactosaminyltransferase
VNSRKSRADRVAIVVSSLGGGGAERVVVDLGRYLHSVGRDVTLFTLTGDGPEAYAVPEGVRHDQICIPEPRHDASEDHIG